ncbi:hypothetical protein HYALB_00011704 [Hymenoscyphus albidus]|uniref:Secreted protein n=1 Tax=Hymenoscyphus albidus TaxID=595503 RepID=A0A9N9LM27_9HELO|nr:hypothetical protein HYALB_00011704 [Hymenoscyphus albidus]
MRFQFIILPALAILAKSSPLDQSPQNPFLARAATTQCFIGKGIVDVNANSIRDCMTSQINAGTWFDNVACAGYRWFLGGENWQSPADCMQVGHACLLSAAGRKNLPPPEFAKCDAKSGTAHCWWAWCPVGQVPGGNADGSCS